MQGNTKKHSPLGECLIVIAVKAIYLLQAAESAQHAAQESQAAESAQQAAESAQQAAVSLAAQQFSTASAGASVFFEPHKLPCKH
ncbi:MAG: hypothetical protein IJP70_10770 [Bacteroidales bacterium]|nr:hypothetical protein [Bacteroidales bacterium]